MKNSLRNFVEKTQRLETEDGLFDAFDDFAATFGFDITSYAVTARKLRAVPIADGVVRQNFPQDWVDRYFAENYAEFDPLLELCRRTTRPFRWYDIAEKMKLSRRQRDYLDGMKEAGLLDGFNIPVFGPIGTVAYFGVASTVGVLDLKQDQIIVLQCACQQVHNRYLELSNNSTNGPINLSRREQEVLGLVATGVSNNQIANQLGISEYTVDTLIRRAFRKLGVNNRMSAVLRAIGLGLLVPE